MPYMDIDHPSIQAELERILKSRCFRSRKTLCKFLTYIVQETLAGKQHEITQYAIATQALHKPMDFESGENPLIRVQAGRLRAQLDEYYETEGRFNPIRIKLPLGSYFPVFLRKTQPSSQSLVIREETAYSQSRGPSIVCIPRNFMADETVGWPFITRLTRDYVTALTHFNYCQVLFADENDWQQPKWPEDAWHQYGADFALFFDLYTDGQAYSLKCSLAHSLNRQIIWAHSFDLGTNYPSPEVYQPVFKRIANDTVGVEKGLSQTYWARQLLDSGKPIAPHHQAIVALRQYSWDVGPETFRQAVRTCNKRLDQFPDDVQALTLSVEYCLDEYMMKFQEIAPIYPLIAQVSEKLLQLAPENTYSHIARALLCFFEEEYTECEAAIKQAQAINPVDIHVTALAGLGYMALGNPHKGGTLIQESIDTSPLYPDWYHLALSLCHYWEGHYLTAIQEAKKAKLRHLWGPMLRTAIYQHTNLQEKGKEEYEQLKAKYPNFTQDSHKLTHGFSGPPNQVMQKLWSQILRLPKQ